MPYRAGTRSRPDSAKLHEVGGAKVSLDERRVAHEGRSVELEVRQSEHGSPERARTLFDGIVDRYPKRLDLVFVYVDKEIKFGSLEAARSVMRKKVRERTLSDKKTKNLFKKWYRIEEEHGTEETRERVKAAAREYVEEERLS